MPKEPAPPAAPPQRLPVWEVEERVVFPLALATLVLPMPQGKNLLEEAHACGDYVALLPVSKGPRKPRSGLGVVALLLRMASSGQPGTGLLLVQGVTRAHLTADGRKGGVRWVRVRTLPDRMDAATGLTASALMRGILEKLDDLSGTPKGISSEVRAFLASVTEPGRMADLVAAQLDLPFPKALELAVEVDPIRRLTGLLGILTTEMEILAIQEKLNRQTRDELDKRQRDYFLRQQLEAIQMELAGGEGADPSGEAAFRKRLESLPASADVKAQLEKEVAKLSRFSPFSEELNQVRAYLDLVFDLPWGVNTSDNLNLALAQKNLDRDHYGLKKAKERILEYLAVSKLRSGNPGTLFCLVGPPGVGKTSLGRAIARTLGRRFVRMSLGGVRDEAEIRGHRRTYIGAMPGRIIQGVKNAGSMNPVFVLDEVDKMGSDWRGDPSAALLEALDPEQNREFVDHYLGFPFDLSGVMFVATANTLETIHPAFLDRLEILELPGYTEEEKLAIAKRHLFPKQRQAHGMDGVEVALEDETLLALIRRYTREAGVRALERGIEAILRKVARKVAQGDVGPHTVKARDLTRLMGTPRFLADERLSKDTVGVAAGLAWTEAGGEMLFVEATAVEGNGALVLTGQMGEVMRESAQAALTFIKEHLREWGLEPKQLAKKDFHIHLPEGAIPKDGPSAGITMAVAMLSTLLGRAPSRTMAFSGEITLRGQVLPVGGLKEKLLAAQRSGIRTAVLPYANRNERRNLPRSVLKGMELLWARDMGEVFRNAFPEVSGAAAGGGRKKRQSKPGKRPARG